MKIGLYPMVADILHTGHLVALEEAKKNCDYLIVALHCKPEYKKPVQSIYERFMQLRAVRFIDEIIPYENKADAKRMIESLDFDVYFLGEDYRDKDFECKDVLLDRHKKIQYLTRVHSMSSTEIKERILNETLH